MPLQERQRKGQEPAAMQSPVAPAEQPMAATYSPAAQDEQLALVWAAASRLRSDVDQVAFPETLTA
jgi:hypothetical protein